jgi:hypothetical protein
MAKALKEVEKVNKELELANKQRKPHTAVN